MTKETDEIVFEDLHGVSEDLETTVEVDLSAEKDGISRHARITPDADDQTPDDDNNSGDNDSEDDDGGSKRDTFSKKFQARLKREQRAKRTESARADEAEDRAANAERELKKFRKAGRKTDSSDLDRQINETETNLEEAFENGASKEQVRLTSHLTDLKARKIAAELMPDDDDDDGHQEPVRKTRQPKNEALDDWMDSQSSWYKRDGFERQTRVANQLDQEVYSDGYDVSDPEYFEELDKRLMKKFPDLYDTDDDGGGRDTRGRRSRRDTAGKRSPVSGAASGAAQNAGSQSTSKIKLGKDDFANMRRFGLDPNDPAVLKEYAANKRQTMLEGA